MKDEREGPIAVKDRRLGTDRRRSRQRTVVVSDVSYATVYLVRHALADIKRARLSDERLPVRTASCGSRRERFGGPVGGRICVVCCVTVYVTSVLIISTVDPSKRYTRSYHVGRLARELCASNRNRAVRQEELDGEREPSEELQG